MATTTSENVDPKEIFAYLLVEEFLMKNNMSGTLDSFRQEWKSRPSEVF